MTSDFRLQHSDVERHTSDFDREVEQLLAVEPSPEFTARVRTRLASEPARTSFRSEWMFRLCEAANPFGAARP